MSCKVHLLDKLVREQVVVWKINGVCTNDSSSALQYPAGIWLQIALKLVSLEVLRACGFSLSSLGPPNFFVFLFHLFTAVLSLYNNSTVLIFATSSSNFTFS